MPRIVLVIVVLAAFSPGAVAQVDNVWMRRRPLNQAHAGGDLEAPHSTLYAFKQAIAEGADQLEMDVQLSGDGVLLVHHDDTVDRTTNSTGRVDAFSLAQLQALDNAYWFVPNCWSCRDLPAAEYRLRGVRTGQIAPPAGYTANDFRISTLREVLETFPDRLLDIEIKGAMPGAAKAAEALAALLAEFGRRHDVLVVSFDDALVSYFKSLAPNVDTSPGLGEATDWFFNRRPLPHHKSLQVPPTFSGIEVVTPTMVADAHRFGLAVQVWLNGNEEENEPFYEALLDMGVDGIIVGKPALFQRTLAARQVAFVTPITVDASVLDLERRSARIPLTCAIEAADRCVGTLRVDGVLPDGSPFLLGPLPLSLRRGQTTTARFAIGRRARSGSWPAGRLELRAQVTPGNADTAATDVPLTLTR
jgi:glycerophosphoryl diester phosphodiesterase